MFRPVRPSASRSLDALFLPARYERVSSRDDRRTENKDARVCTCARCHLRGNLRWNVLDGDINNSKEPAMMDRLRIRAALPFYFAKAENSAVDVIASQRS